MTPTFSPRRYAGLVFSFIFAATLTTTDVASAQPRSPSYAASGIIEAIVATQNGTIPLGAAQVVVRDAGGRDVVTLLSDGDGHARVDKLRAGKYTLIVSLDGFTPTTKAVTVMADSTTEVAVDLALAAVTATVNVVAPATIVSTADTLSKSDAIDSADAEQLAPGGGLQSALRLLASVIDVPGGVSIKGGRPTQAGMQIGSTTLVDPTIGLVRLTLPDDAIDSVAVLPNPYAVEYGRFSSGLVVIRTRRAGDHWKLRLNNLDPTFRTKRHAELYTIKGIASFGPHIELGGPIVKDRLFVEETAQYRYSATDVPSRPEDELITSHWFSSFTRVDANLTPKHSLVATGSFFPSRTNMATLGTFVPPDSTVDLKERVNYAAFTERALWSDTVVGESTVQVHGYRTEVSPMGTAPMALWPDTRAGNFYNVQERTPSTTQWIESLSTSANGPGGLHLFKVGVDVLHSQYDGTSVSRPVLIYRADGTIVRRLDFSGPSFETVHSTDVALFAQDRVQPSTRWFAEYGARLDRDAVLHRWNLTPRVGSALLLDETGSHVLRGGFGLFYERTPLAAGAFDQFEAPVETRFAADGITLQGSPVFFGRMMAPDLRTARGRTWDVAYDYRFNPRWTINIGLLDRRGSHELIVDTTQQDERGLWTLSSDGRSQYREISAGAHFKWASRADLNVSYARSVARSDANSLSAFLDTLMWPIISPNSYGVAAGDVPNRLFGRGYVLPTPTWLLLGILDWRTGTPYSVVNESLDIVGDRNSRRMPNRMRLDLGVEHHFMFLKWKPWIGVRAYNALDSFIPVDVQANTGSAAFGTFYNSDYRQLRLQLRFER